MEGACFNHADRGHGLLSPPGSHSGFKTYSWVLKLSFSEFVPEGHTSLGFWEVYASTLKTCSPAGDGPAGDGPTAGGPVAGGPAAGVHAAVTLQCNLDDVDSNKCD